MATSMKPELTRREQFSAYAHMLKERFHRGFLSQLQGLPQWVVWRSELEEGKNKKVPYNPNRNLIRASVKIPKSWGTLDQTITALATGNYSGIGFMITPPLVMIDLDNSFDRKTGTITNPEVTSIIQTLKTYTEASPYKGLHALAYVGKPLERNLHTDAVEIYGNDRFTTITTDHIPDTPTTIELRTKEVEALYKLYFPSVEETSIQNTGGVLATSRLTELPPEAANDPLLQQLLRGDITGFKSPSNADFVLVLKLLHWTGDNVELTRRLFLESGLYRPGKTERKTAGTTYLDYTIQNALRKRRNPPQRR